MRDKNLIDYDDILIEKITVYSEKIERSEVDEREEARYSSAINSERVKQRYGDMTTLCKNAIAQCEEIIFIDREFIVPKELLTE